MKLKNFSHIEHSLLKKTINQKKRLLHAIYPKLSTKRNEATRFF